jgi:hypothetical protein
MGRQPSSVLALALATRIEVPTTTEATYGAASRTSQPGSRHGGGAPEGPGHGGEDLLPGGGQVVDDVVGLPGAAALQGGHGGRGGVLVVDPAEHPAPGHGHAAPGQQVPHVPGVPAVQQAVAQGDPLGHAERLLLGGAHGGHVGVAAVPRRQPEWVLLGEEAWAVVAVAVAKDERLGEEPPGPEDLRGGQQVGGALGAQPVGQGHAAVP